MNYGIFKFVQINMKHLLYCHQRTSQLDNGFDGEEGIDK